MAEKLITVRRSGTNGLSFEPPGPVEVGDGDQVRWGFPDLPNDQFGFVFFDTRLGPFSSIRSFSNRQILGKGSNGQAGLYSYTAMILQLDRTQPIATGRGEINNRAIRVNTTPEVCVTFHPAANGTPASLEVAPYRLSLNPGDTATWCFHGLPEGTFANFQFDPTTSAMKEATGPFVAFYACNGSDAGTIFASGTGFVAALPEACDEYRYHIEVRNSNGELIASHDPVIDNIGPPPTHP
jgi:hypothetical protein